MSFCRVTATNLAMIEVTNRKIWYEGKIIGQPFKEMMGSDCERCTSWCSTHTLPGCFFLSRYHVVSTYTSKFNFIDSYKKSRASAVLKLMKLRNAQQNCVQKSDTKLQPNREINVENKLMNITKTQQNALIHNEIDHQTHFISNSTFYIFRHLGAIIREIFSNKSSKWWWHLGVETCRSWYRI